MLLIKSQKLKVKEAGLEPNFLDRKLPNLLVREENVALPDELGINIVHSKEDAFSQRIADLRFVIIQIITSSAMVYKI